MNEIQKKILLQGQGLREMQDVELVRFILDDSRDGEKI